jgi:magnesium-transporting ATPase (P-type)
MIFWLVLKLEISYNRVIIYLEGFWVFLLEDLFEDYIFAWWNIWVSIILFFCLKILFNVNGKATMWHTPCLSSEIALMFIWWLYIVITTTDTCSIWSLFEIIFAFLNQILKTPTNFLKAWWIYFLVTLWCAYWMLILAPPPKKIYLLTTHKYCKHMGLIEGSSLLTFQLTRFLYGWYLLGMELREDATRTLMQTKVTRPHGIMKKVTYKYDERIF